MASQKKDLEQELVKVKSQLAALQNELDEYRERFYLVAESANDGLWDWNIETNTLYNSPRWKKTLGFQDDELAPSVETWSKQVHPDDLSYVMKQLQAHMAGKTPFYHAEYRMRTKEGEYIWVLDRGRAMFDANGKPKRVAGSLTDINERKINEDKLAENELRLRTILNCMSEGILVLDKEAKFMYANPAFSRLLGLTVKQVEGRTPLDPNWRVIHEDGSPYPGDTHPSWVTLKTGKPIHNAIQGVYSADGNLNWIQVNAEPMFRPGSEETTGVVVTFTDITERKDAEQRIEKLAYYDTLTNLPNRLMLQDRLNQALAAAQRNKSSLAVMMIDLDHFKTINDSLGHVVGDHLLRQVAQRLQCCVREMDTISRMGGDEFIAVLQNTDINDAASVAQRILNCLEETYIIEEHRLTTSPSIGISMYPTDGKDSEALIKQADAAMYHAKDVGRNNYQFFTTEINASAQKRMGVVSGLREALENNQFLLHYQPQLETLSKCILGAEALLRWKHPEKGLIPPGEFIPVAEDTSLIVPIGTWVINEVCRQIRAWLDQGLEVCRISINLAARQLHEHNLLDTITDAIDRHDIPSNLLAFELTESTIMTNSLTIDKNLQALHDLGIELSIDDFGTGYSSLSYLKHFPIDWLKIDRSFIRDLPDDIDDKAIVTAVIGLAQNLKRQVIAEGVETEEQLALLQSLGCTAAQGYLLSRPLASEKFAVYLDNTHLFTSA